MGFVSSIASKLTGADQQADAMTRAAENQASATRASAEQATKATQEAAKQTAMQASQTAARNAALEAAATATEPTTTNPDVQLATPTDSASGTAKKRREKFGIGSKDTGVQI